MRLAVVVLFSVFLLASFARQAQAAETGQPATTAEASQAHIQALEDALAEAKDRVRELESELSNAQNTITSLEKQNADQAVALATTDTAPLQPKTRTVDGEPLNNAYNPKRPVEQSDVIAQKFTPGRQAQPVAITTLEADDIERGGIRHLDRVAALVPGMQYGQSGNEARISIRGTRTNRTGAEAEQVVAIYEDGVSVPTTTQAMGPYFDIDRIEVLRGPQGVMYGRNAFGGAINVISNKPDLTGWDASLEGTVGYADGTRFEAMINVPVFSSLATRIAVRSDVHSGYVNNQVLEGDADDLRDRKQQFFRWTTKWQATDTLSLLLNIASLDQNQTGSGMWGYHQLGAYVDGAFQPGHQFAPDDASNADRDGWNVSRNFASLEDQENLSGTLSLDWNMGFADLDVFVNKSKFENQQVFDSDYSDGGDPFNSDFNGWNSFRDSLSGEIRLTSNSDGRFDWLAGVYRHEMESNWGWLKTVDRHFVQPEWDSTGIYTTDSTSAFARAGFSVTEKLRLAAGLRWYEDNKELRTGSKDSWSGVLWNAALSYQFTDNINSYFSASTGYRPGGINETPGVPATFDSENVTAYEIGMKSIFADGSLVLNLSAYFNDYKDIQAQSFTILPLPGSAGLMDYMSTGGDMESKGFEAEIQWLPGSRWNISANIAWLDATFTDYEVPAIAGLGYIDGHSMGDMLSLNGWRPALSPEWSFGLQASYIFDLGKGGTFTPMLQTAYVGDQYANDLNLEGALQKSHTKTDLRMFWDWPGNKIRMQVYLENIEEENNLNNVVIYNPEERPEIATFLGNWGDLMTYGVILSYKY